MSIVERRVWWFVAVAAVALKFWLVAPQALVALEGATHDDRLFLVLADSIRAGHWLGDYNRLTLAKGPFYPLWIAAAHALHVPLLTSQHLAYLVACVLAALALRPALPSARWAFVLFLLLWWNPVTTDSGIGHRVLRQSIYVPLALATVAGLIALASGPRTRRAALTWGGVTGLAAAAFYLTREEGVWLAPVVLALAAYAALNPRAPRRLALLGLATATTTFSLGTGAVCALNARAYGWGGTVEFRQPAFLDAHGALLRFTPPQPIPYVFVTRATREALYAHSPLFAQLAPHLDGDLGTSWAVPSGILTGLPPQQREIAGGWFMWALRDSVERAGHGTNAATARAYYRALADELNALADTGVVPAGPPRSGMLPPWQPAYTARALDRFPAFVTYFLRLEGIDARQAASAGNGEAAGLFARLTCETIAPYDQAAATALHGPRIHALQSLRHAYAATSPYLAALAFLAATLALVRDLRARFLRVLTLLNVMLPGALLAVLLINLLIEATSFPTLNVGAFSPAYALLFLWFLTSFSNVLRPSP